MMSTFSFLTRAMNSRCVYAINYIVFNVFTCVHFLMLSPEPFLHSLAHSVSHAYHTCYLISISTYKSAHVHFFLQAVIVISGYERNANEARAAIEQLVADLQEMMSEDIRLDRRVHARIIGARGKAIRKLMEEFKVGATCIC